MNSTRTEPPEDPRQSLRAWLPHVAVLGLVAASGWWLLVVIAPVREALLLAGSLSALTYPLLFAPCHRQLVRWFPHWQDEQRRYVGALASTVALAALLAALLLGALWAVVGGLGSTLRAVIGLAMHDQIQIRNVVELVCERAAGLARLYPDLHLNVDGLRQTLQETLGQASVGPAVLSYLVTGTSGVIAQGALMLVTLFYLYSQGPRLVRLLLSCLPLTQDQRDGLSVRFRATAMHLLTGTLARAAAHGVALGLLAWAIGGFNPILVALVAAFVCLLPVVGPAVAWLPLASVLWSQGDMLGASCLAVSSILSAWLIEHRAYVVAAAMGTDAVWLSFLLFLSVIGGVLGYGVRGLVLGPAAVLTLTIMANFLPLLYAERRPGDGAVGD